MIVRLAVMALVGLYLGGLLPRSLVTGQLSWLPWLLAALIVFAGPAVFRRSIRQLFAHGRKLWSRVPGISLAR